MTTNADTDDNVLPPDARIDAGWTDDCQGKKDFDGNIISISTRYWPRGGGYWVINNQPGGHIDIQENDARPKIKPSAKSEILLYFKDAEGDSDSVNLVSQKFEGDSLELVQAAVEAWGQQQFRRIEAVLRNEFSKGANQ